MFSATPGTLSGPNNYSNSWDFNQWSTCKKSHSYINRQESYKYTGGTMVPYDYGKPSIKASDRSQHLETKIQDILALNCILHWLILSPTPCRGSNYHCRLLAIVTFLLYESNLFGLDIFSRANQVKQDSMESPVVGSEWCKYVLNLLLTSLLSSSSLKSSQPEEEWVTLLKIKPLPSSLFVHDQCRLTLIHILSSQGRQWAAHKPGSL